MMNVLLLATLLACLAPTILALNGGASMIETMNGWKNLEVVTEGDVLNDWVIPTKLDGIGAYLENNNALILQVNHELDAPDATISELTLNVSAVREAIENVMTDNFKLPPFVTSARRAFDRWTVDGALPETADMRWSYTTSDFCKFCSSQSYEPHHYGFVDRLYITGEECNGGRVVVLDSANRDLYVLSGVTGGPANSTSSYGGMPFDSIENAAVIDTHAKNHVTFLLSADGGTHTLMLYVGKKNVDANNQPSNSFLARNGLLYGQWWYLALDGSFVTAESGATLVRAPKLEDIDTNPNNPTQNVLAESTSGVYMLDFDLQFQNGSFQHAASTFTMRQIMDHDVEAHQHSDNVDWTTNNLIFVNKDHDEGGVWYMTPEGEHKTQVGKTKPLGESSGILDISALLGYPAASVVVTTNQGIPSSMALLLNPTLLNVVGQDAIVYEEEEAIDEACPISDSNVNRIVVEAEDGVLVDGNVARLDADYCGDGYVVFGKITESAGIIFMVDIPLPGDYDISVRFANGDNMDRPGVLFVNGVDQESIFNFEATGGWSSWDVETMRLTVEDSGAISLGIWWPNGGARPSIDLLVVDQMLPPEDNREFVLEAIDANENGGASEDSKGDDEEFDPSASTRSLLAPCYVFAMGRQ